MAQLKPWIYTAHDDQTTVKLNGRHSDNTTRNLNSPHRHLLNSTELIPAGLAANSSTNINPGAPQQFSFLHENATSETGPGVGAIN